MISSACSSVETRAYATPRPGSRSTAARRALPTVAPGSNLVERTKERKVQVHIRAVFDTTHFNQNTTSGDANDRQGTWVYWRME